MQATAQRSKRAAAEQPQVGQAGKRSKGTAATVTAQRQQQQAVAKALAGVKAAAQAGAEVGAEAPVRHHFLPLRPAPLHNTCLQYSILQTCVVLCLTVNPLACVQCAINNCACAFMSCHPVRSCALKRHTTSHKCRTISREYVAQCSQ